MEINGINIRDIRDAQDILTALEIIRATLENLSDDMQNNYTNYSETTQAFRDSKADINSILDSLNRLQINAQDLNKTNEITSNKINENANIITTAFKTEIDKNIDLLERKFTRYKSDTIFNIDKAINSIDLHKFDNSIKSMLNDKIEALKIEVENIEINNQNFAKINQNLDNVLTNANQNLKDSISQTFEDMDNNLTTFKRVTKTLNFMVISATFIGGLALGLLGGGSVSFLKLKEYYDIKIKDLDDKYLKNEINEDKLIWYKEKYNIKATEFSDAKEQHILIIPSDNIKNIQEREKSRYIIELK